MTVAATTIPAGVQPVDRSALVALARIESGRMLRRLSIWIGLGLSVVLAVLYARAPQDWSSQKYQSLVPLSVYPMTMGVFVAGVRSGHRDRSHRLPPLAEEAPLDGDSRTLARQASLIVPTAMIALLMAVIGVVSRIEGGMQVGVGRAWTDSAVHSVFELAQPALAVAAIGAAAVAIGRAVQRSGPAIVIGMVLLFFLGGAYWLWNGRVVYSTALMQVQPLGFDERELVHVPTAALHDVYLVGLIVLFCGLSVRGRRRRQLASSGVAVAVAAVVGQLVVAPF